MKYDKPPMGWNSWDCYGASVTEKEVKANTDYMQKYLKDYGWEYIVVDIQWYEPTANSSIYNDLAPLITDQYGRLIPAENRFPSSENGRGFKPLADYVHSKDLKFGIHIMRGIPRQAVYNDMPVKGTDYTARDIADGHSVCKWNTDMYGIDTSHQAAQDWYDSIFELYAEWEVDYIKIDNIAYPYYKDEIEMVSKAIQNCGRDMYLSLSPGPAPIEAASHLKKYANSWRISADYWDRWEDLYDQFELCSKWVEHAEEGSWPDADMLPFGHIAIRSEEHHRTDRWTEFSHDEQRFMMSLWSLARSPLMFGGEMTDNDKFTLDLLTNKEVINILKKSKNNRQLYRENDCATWTAEGYDGEIYLAHFNLNGDKKEIITNLNQIGLSGEFKVKDIWEKKDLENTSQQIISTVNPHAVKLYKLSSVK